MNQLICFHYARARLQGLHEEEEAIVVQKLHDVRDGSPEKLIIVDIEMHSNQLGTRTTGTT